MGTVRSATNNGNLKEKYKPNKEGILALDHGLRGGYCLDRHIVTIMIVSGPPAGEREAVEKV